MITSILRFCAVLTRRARRYLKQWAKPATATLVIGTLLGITHCSLRRGCLDHMIALHSSQLRRTVRAYMDCHNQSRPRQGIEQRVPAQYLRTYPPLSGPIVATPVLGDLHHAYSRSAHLH